MCESIDLYICINNIILFMNVLHIEEKNLEAIINHLITLNVTFPI